MRCFFYCLLIVPLALGVPQAQAQTAKIQKELDQKLERMRADQTALEQLIAEALKNNPDIRVAEAKVCDAEADLQRTRLKVLSEITLLHTETKTAQTAVEEAARRYTRLTKLYESKAVPDQALEEGKQALVKSKANAALIEAKLPYLLGRASVVDLVVRWQTAGQIDNQELKSAGRNPPGAEKVPDEVFLRRAMLDLFGRVPTAEETRDFLKNASKDGPEKRVEQLLRSDKLQAEHLQRWLERKPQLEGDLRRLADLQWELQLSRPLLLMPTVKTESPLANKLRKALDTPVHLEASGISAENLLEHVRDTMLTGFNVVLRVKGLKKDVHNVHVREPIPLGAFLQYLEDELGVVFVLRDYGLVIVAADERLPPGAVDAVAFWKSSQRADKTSQTKDKK